jgi:DNA-binding HxlR family transcriptional regulator
MERKSFAEMGCSVAQCLEVVGDSWTMLIVRDAFNGYARFDELQERLGIPRNTLRDRLAKLVESGVLVKEPYSEHPARFEYRLTERGRDLWPVLSAMRQWGDRHGAEARPVVRNVHTACGTTVRTVTICETCGEPVGPDASALLELSPAPAGTALHDALHSA